MNTKTIAYGPLLLGILASAAVLGIANPTASTSPLTLTGTAERPPAAIDSPGRDHLPLPDLSAAGSSGRRLAYVGPATAGAEEGSAALAYVGPATAGAEEGSAAIA